MKKVFKVLLLLIFLFTLISCEPEDGNKPTGSKQPADTGYDGPIVNFTVFSFQNENQPPSYNKIYNWIKNNFGITFSWDIHPDDKDNRISELISSGNLPDLVEVDSERFQNAGCLIDLKPLIEQYCPNIKEHYKDAWIKMLDADDGHIYSLPNYGIISGADSGTYYNQNAFWIQKEVLKEFGYPVIKTVDEYFDLLENYKVKYPKINNEDTIPFSIYMYDWEAFNLWNPPSFLAGYPNDSVGHVVKNGNKYTFVNNYTDENAERWFKLSNGYYHRGLIDPDSFSDSHDVWTNKLKSGRILGHFTQGWEWMVDLETHHFENNMWERTYAPLPVVFDETITPWYRDQPLPNLQRGYGITTRCSQEKVLRILEFFEAMLEPENSKILEWGFEGEDYYVDNSGRPYRTNNQRNEQATSDWKAHNKATLLHGEMPKWEGSYPDGYFVSMDSQPWEYISTLASKDIDVEIFEAYNVGSYAALVDKNPPKNPGWYPLWEWQPSSGSAAESMDTIHELMLNKIPEIIKCSPSVFDQKWNEYVTEAKSISAEFDTYMQEQLDTLVQKYGGFAE